MAIFRFFFVVAVLVVVIRLRLFRLRRDRLRQRLGLLMLALRHRPSYQSCGGLTSTGSLFSRALVGGPAILEGRPGVSQFHRLRVST